MPFIRAKTRKKLSWPDRQPTSSTYYYLVENYRENGRVRQRIIAYLGKYPTVEEALAGLPGEIEWLQKSLVRDYQRRDRCKADYEKESARFSEPFVFNEKWGISHDRQERLHWESRQPQGRTWKRLQGAVNDYQMTERWFARDQKYIAETEARLAKIQAFSNSDGRVHESPEAKTLVDAIVA
jgi:hypothetical protein